MKLLIEQGANVNRARADLVTSMFMAAQENHVDVVKVLIEHGANVDAMTGIKWKEKGEEFNPNIA